MNVTIQEAYEAACKLIGEQQMQMHFMAQALAEAQRKLAEAEKLNTERQGQAA